MWVFLSAALLAGAGLGWGAQRTANLFVGDTAIRGSGYEALGALGAAVTGWCLVFGREPRVWLLPAAALLLWWCLTLAATDLCSQRLPNLLTLPALPVIVGFGVGTGRATAAVVGGLLLAAMYLTAYLCAPRSLGAGDVKLALATGAVTGMAGGDTWLYAAGLAPVLTAAAGCVVLCVRRGAPARVRVPHGPAMCAGTLLALLCAQMS
ncbi:MAG: A24 family peptidase [Rhodococcus sp. (in: high G+C Gram-positive bacteria)]|uniref:prepilin peptidase n=1 Tax=Rhodococcus sp. TaxID=1831 RepID=UPI003BAF0FC6